MKEMAAQVNFFCFLMFFFCLACNMVPENWHICVNKGITYLLTTYTGRQHLEYGMPAWSANLVADINNQERIQR